MSHRQTDRIEGRNIELRIAKTMKIICAGFLKADTNQGLLYQLNRLKEDCASRHGLPVPAHG